MIKFKLSKLTKYHPKYYLLVGVALLVLGFLIFTYLAGQASAAWYDLSWSYRKQLVFNNAASTTSLTDFPVMVKLTSSNFNFSQAKTNGEDIRFTDSDGTTILSHEFEDYNSSTQTATIWVKVPLIDSASTTDSIYLYWGNSGASDTQDTDNTWSSNYKGVYHLEDSAASTTVTDSSGLANHLTASGNTNTQYASSSGQIGSGFLTVGTPHKLPNIGLQNNAQYQDFVLDSSNNPVIAYWEGTTYDLIIVHCNDPDCKGDDESVTSPDTNTGTSSSWPSIALDSNGYPVIAYYDAVNANLNVLRCNDINCAGGDDTPVAVDSTGNVGLYADIHLDSSNYPVVVYYDTTNTNLKIVHCNDVSCAGSNESIVTIDGTGAPVGGIIKGNSLDLNSVGYPVITSFESTNADLRLIVCNDANCAGGDDTPVSIVTTNDTGRHSKIILDSSDFPRIVYEEWTGRDTYYLHCNDTLCAGGNDTPVLIDNAVADYPDLSFTTAGIPVIGYTSGTLYPKVAICTNIACSSNTNTILTTTNQNFGFAYPTIQVSTANSIVVIGQSIGKTGYSDLHLYTTIPKLARAYDSDFDFGTGSFSVSTWFKAKDIDHAQNNDILSRYDTDQGFQMYLNYGGYPCIGIDDDATWGPDDSACTSQSSYTSNADSGQALAAVELSLALDSSGFPMIAYYDGSTQLNLEYIHCNDLYCAGSDETTVTLDSTGTVGSQPAMVLDSNGYPVISYQDVTNGDLKVARCGDANCSSSTVSTVDNSAASVGTRSSITLDSNSYPVITYFDTTNFDLKFVHCNDVNCAGGDDGPVALYSTNVSGNMSSVKLDASGYPVIAFLYNNANDLYFIHCNDANCVSETPTTIDATGTTGHWPSLQLDASGYPVISYFDYSNNNLKLMHCNDVNCAGSNESITTPSYGGYGLNSLLLNSAGYPVILHTSQGNWNQVLTTCNDANCSGGDETNNQLRQDPQNYYYASHQLDASGNIVVATRDTLGDIGIYRPGTPTYTNTVPKDDGQWHHLVGVKNGTSSLTLYLDGVAVATDSSILATSTLTSNSATLNLGESITNLLSTKGWEGWLDEVQIDSTARSSDWIQAQYLSESNNFINVKYTQYGYAVNLLSNFTDNSSPLKNNLVAHYKFDEGAGTVANNSSSIGSVLNGTLTNTPTWNSNGKLNGALNFNGSDNYISIPNNSNLNFSSTGVYSVSVWVNPTTVANPMTIYYKSNTGNGFAIGSNSARAFVWFPGASAPNSNGNSLCRTNSALPTNKWSQLTFTWNNGNCKLYLNGVLQTDITVTGATSYTAGTTLIAYGSGSPPTCAGSQLCYFPGLIDELKIYSAQLTADEIKQDYNQKSNLSLGSLSDTSGLSGGSVASNSASAQYCIPGDTSTCRAPIAEWKFEEGTGTSAQDTSGNGSTGTITPANGKYAPGKIGNSYLFDNSATVIDAGSPTILDNLTASTMTLSTWIYPLSQGENSVAFIASKTVGTTPSAGWHLRFGNTYAVNFSVDGATDLVKVTSNNAITPNAWNHLVLTWDGVITTASSVHIYVNGKETTYATSTDGASIVDDASSTFRIGSNDATTRTFDGQIDDLRIFNYVRTPSQIAWDLNKGKPVAQWKLNDCTGTTANDSSGNNIVGTISIGASGTNTTIGTCTTSGAWFDGASGKFNSSLELDGTDDSISMGDPASEILDMGTGNFSVSAWIKTTASGSMRIINKRNSSNVGYELYLENGQNTLGMLIGDAGGFTFGDSTGTENLRDGNWHHVAVTFNRSAAATYYVDGKMTGTPKTISTRSGTISNSQTFYLGRLGTAASSFFNGQIDEVSIYNYLLTEAQIKNIYNNSSAIRFSP